MERCLMIVIDTHVLVWWVSGSILLPDTAREEIESTIENGGEVVVSAISVWEIGMLIKTGRLVFSIDPEDWLAEVSQIDGVRLMPVDAEISIKSTMLPGKFHNDPADRVIVATALKLEAPLITMDERIINYEHIETIS